MSKNIVLIGMPGSGKTTIGLILAKKLNKEFVDTDELIVEKERKSIADMFAISEDYFRDAESMCAKELSNKNSLVISTGGGIIKREENIEYLKNNSIIIFLNRSPENIIRDVDIQKRPLLKDGIDNLYKLYNERINLYKKYCDFEVINDREIDDTVNNLLQELAGRSFTVVQDDNSIHKFKD